MHLLAYLGFVFSFFDQASTSCPSQCTCDSPSRRDGTASRLVLCNDPDMYEIPVNVPVDTMKLRIEKTVIRRIPAEAFYYLVELKYLWVTYNSVASIDTGSFYNLKHLHELRLDGNLLSLFPWESLLEMPNLRTLDLHNNRITSMPGEATRYLKNLTYLDISSNRLITLPPDLLDTWTHFSADLVSRRGMDLPSSRIILGLQDNPWFCDCHISKVMELSKVVNPTVVLLDPLLLCSGPENLMGILFQRAELEQCLKPSVMTSATKITSALGSNVLLRCDATGHPTPQLIWSREDNLPVNSTVIQETPGDGIRWSIISLTGISYKDAGDYSCKAKNLAGTSEAIVSVTVVGIVTTTISPQNLGKRVGTDQPLEEAKHTIEKTTLLLTSSSSPATSSSFSTSTVSSSSATVFPSSIITSTTIPIITEISASTKMTSRKPPKSFSNGKRHSKVVMTGSKVPPASASKKDVSLLSPAAITESGIIIMNLKVVNETYESVTLTWKAVNITKNSAVTVLYSKYGEEDMLPLSVDSSESEVTIDGLEAGMQYVACVCPKGVPPKTDQCITFSTDRMNEKANSQISFLIVASSAGCVIVLSLIFYLLYKVLRLQYKPKGIREDDLAKETYIKFETLSPRPHPARELWTQRRTDESERLLLFSRSSVDSPMTFKNEGSRSEYYC